MAKATVDTSRYARRGVSSGKSEVHAATKNMDKGLYPGAFCSIHRDVLGGDPRYCNIQHSDGSGSKAALAYLAWKLGQSLKVWRGILLDSFIMNIDDVGCVGGLGPFLVSLIIDRNSHLIPGEVIATLIEMCQEICDELSEMGIHCCFTGGETADLPNQVRTITVNNTITTRFPRKQIIDASRIKPGAFIVGFSSTGQANWENEPNSSMGSNGLTNAIHDTLRPLYRQHTETYSPETKKNLIYSGPHFLGDKLMEDPRFTIETALLSPTRTYLPLIKDLTESIGAKYILGLIHCSGGGQTKIGKFGQPGIMYVKYNLFPIPPLFQMLQEVRDLPIREMYQSYNMGHRLEAVVESRKLANECIAISKQNGIDARVVGEVVPIKNQRVRKVQIVLGRKKLKPYTFKV